VSGRIVVHSLDHASAAAAAAASLGVPVTLTSAPGAGIYGGALWFKTLIEAAATSRPEARIACVLDCGDAAGAVLAGLRVGLRHMRFTGSEATRARLAALAAEIGALIEGDEKVALLDLRGETRLESACRKFLAEGGNDP
jgi:hypothetical protein